jgi:D-alanine-D-alanine ligase-like ATP-grasp enzyme
VSSKHSKPFLGPLLRKLAPKIGARVVLEPEWGFAGQIIFKSGRVRYFRYNSLDLNSLGATEISKDKDYANFFLKAQGYPTVPASKSFFSPAWAKAIASRKDIGAAYAYAQKLTLPVIIKPNSGSQGRGVEKVFTKKDFYRAARAICKYDRVFLVQKVLIGHDYRLVVLDGEVISAYERVPLYVVGDGHSSIKQLLLKKQKEFVKSVRDTQIKLTDPRILNKLKHQKLTFASKPKTGEKVYLLDNANLSTGGESLDMTGYVHPLFQRLAVNITRDMGLRLCGVDLMVDGDIAEAPKLGPKNMRNYVVLEINSAPGLDHYVTTGLKQKRIVESLYLKVLKALEK